MVSIQHSLSLCVGALVQTDVSMAVSVSLFFLCVFVGRGDLTMKMTPQTENSSTTSRTLASAFFDIGCRRRCCWLLCRLLSACVSDLRASPANFQHRRKCHHPHRDRKEKKRVRLHPGPRRDDSRAPILATYGLMGHTVTSTRRIFGTPQNPSKRRIGTCVHHQHHKHRHHRRRRRSLHTHTHKNRVTTTQ